jgi:ribosomal protein L31E
MKIIRPKTLGTLQIKKAIAGNYLIENGINKPPNKIRIPCDTYEDSLEIIKQLKNAKVGDVIYV